MIIGCHLSIAGGVHKALEAAGELGIAAVAMFVRNQRQWKAAPLSPEAITLFKQARKEFGIRRIVAHGSYLINLAGEDAVRANSKAALLDEVGRCQQLGIDAYVFHPGSTGLMDQDQGPARVAEALNELSDKMQQMDVKVLLETTAAAGNMLGGTFENLAAMLGLIERKERFGVCLDTCHVFAAGYDIRTAETYADTMAQLDRVVGLDKLLAVHANDSKGYLGSCLDRHEHIGQGLIGTEAFRLLLADARLKDIPLLLETPKDEELGHLEMDKMNIATLRRLEGKRRVVSS